MKRSSDNSKIFLILFLLSITTTEELQTIQAVGDSLTMKAIYKNEFHFFLLRPRVLEVEVLSAIASENGAKLLESDGLKPNIVSIGKDNDIEVFLREKQYFMHKILYTDTTRAYKTASFHKDNYQLVYIGDNRLLDTEIFSGSIYLHLINYKADELKSEVITKPSSTQHFVLKFRVGGIAVFTPNGDKIDIYLYDDQLNFQVKITSSNNIQTNNLKAYELETNVFILCNIINNSLQITGGEYTISSNSINFKSSFTALSPCDNEFWYQVAPIEETGQVIAVCSQYSSGDFRIRKFNSNKLKGDTLLTDYYSIDRLYDIISLSNHSFLILSIGKYSFSSNKRMKYENYVYPYCMDYILEIDTNENVSIYKEGIFSSETEILSITIGPKKGNVVGFDSTPIVLETENPVNTIYFRRGTSGTYSFRYEIVLRNDGLMYSSPCLVTVIVLCHPSCDTCNQIGDDDRNDCLSCSSGGLMPYNDNDILGNCKSTCDDGYYSDINFFCRKCSNKCLTCIDEATIEEDKCLTCPPGTFSFKINDAYNCISACPKYYYADSNNNCLKCYDTCEECSVGGTEENHNCSKCPIGDFILPLDYPTTKYNCYDECPDSYFVVNNQCIKCFDTCIHCQNIGNDQYHNCESCKENLFFLPSANDDSIGNCLPQCPSNSFANGQNCVTCYQDCETCDEKGIDSNHKCLTCLSDKFVLLSKSEVVHGNCVSDCPENSFPFGDKKCLKCFPFCSKCQKEGSFTDNNCSTCIDGLLQLPIESDTNFNNCVYECPDGYYTEDDIKCEKCYSSCAKCSKGAHQTIHNCEKCIEGYIKHPIISSNCVIDCKENEVNWLFNDQGDYECTSTSECTVGHPFLEPKYTQCVKSCTLDPECIQCQKEVLYEHKKGCVKVCPEFYQANDNKVCERIPIEGLSPPQTSSNGTIIYDSTNSKEDFIGDLDNMVEKSIEDILNSNKGDPIVVTKSEDYEYVFSKVGADISSESNGANIDLGECELKLREAYKIPNDEDLYIGQVIFPDVGHVKNVMQYAVYNSEGKQLNLDVCDGLKLKIDQPLDIDELLLFEAKRLMTELGIDVFDPNSTFYTNVCFNYTDLDNKDYTLQTRRDKFIDEQAFCFKDCQYAGINFESNNAICNCNPSQEKIKPVIDESQFLNNILSALPLSNMRMFTCYNLFFEPNLTKNYGLLAVLAIQGIEILFFVMYIFIQMPIMYGKCTFIHLNPPIKANSLTSDKPFNSNSPSDKRSDIPEKSRNNLHVSNTNLPIFDNDKKPESKSTMLEHNLSKNAKLFSQKSIVAIQGPLPDSYQNEDLNEMEYKDALENDKRKFCEYYWCIIKEKEMVLGTFASDDPFNPYMQRIFICLFILSAYFFVNALFYTDEFVATDNYFDFMFILDNELEKSFFTSLIIKVISKLITLLLGLGKKLRKAFKTKESDIKYQREVAHLIKGNKINIIILFVIIIITDIVMIYYITIFCRLYPNNQIIWIISTVISMMFNLALSALLCLLMAIIRYLAFRYQKECIYKMSGYVAELM